ncbi:2-methylfumaryl-CoA isomerase [Pseudomonas fluorescens]|uniref:2-methylfumaryl-CoA isomerase n=1 Tax=Pseudomonas fluorescens TaxID=294 RepID=A0A8H2NUD1_PSEFL|nr:CoA transferase [Pseudomonas fluorescens]VVP21087.1 2-methylfumaryl-CoA isomerase [Pseudomonas fluorescens]
MSEAILKGMRVVEVSAFVAAPLGGMTLAQMGADVIRIDGLDGGLDYRRWPVTDDNTSLFWAGLNKGKRSVAIDINNPQGRELAQALITAPGIDAGMLLTNFPPRGWLDYDTLRAQRADLIQLTIQGDRHGGSAVDYTVNPRIGLPYITGPQGANGAVNHVLPAWDLITGQMAAVGLLAAERQRSRLGIGQQVKLALEDVALAVMGHLGFLAEAQRGVQRQRHGNDLFGAFGRDFVTRDGQRIMVVGLTLKQWRSLCEVTAITEQVAALGRHLQVDLNLEGERFHTREALASLVSPWVAARTLEEITAIFEDSSVCWSHYQSISTLLEQDPSCSEQNPLFKLLEQPGIGQILTPGIPLRFNGDYRTPQPAPQLGADTEAVLMDVLGLSSSEFGALHDQGLVRIAHP